MLIYILVLEVGIVAGSGIDAWLRSDERHTWGRRWLWWHLAPLVALSIGLAAGLGAAARHCAARTVANYQRRDHAAPLLGPGPRSHPPPPRNTSDCRSVPRQPSLGAPPTKHSHRPSPRGSGQEDRHACMIQ